MDGKRPPVTRIVTAQTFTYSTHRTHRTHRTRPQEGENARFRQGTVEYKFPGPLNPNHPHLLGLGGGRKLHHPDPGRLVEVERRQHHRNQALRGSIHPIPSLGVEHALRGVRLEVLREAETFLNLHAK